MSSSGRDASYRVGGEELALLLSGCSAEEARATVEELHTTLRRVDVPARRASLGERGESPPFRTWPPIATTS